MHDGQAACACSSIHLQHPKIDSGGTPYAMCRPDVDVNGRLLSDYVLSYLTSQPHQRIQIHALVVRDMSKALPKLRKAIRRDHDELRGRVLICKMLARP